MSKTEKYHFKKSIMSPEFFNAVSQVSFDQTKDDLIESMSCLHWHWRHFQLESPKEPSRRFASRVRSPEANGRTGEWRREGKKDEGNA